MIIIAYVLFISLASASCCCRSFFAIRRSRHREHPMVRNVATNMNPHNIGILNNAYLVSFNAFNHTSSRSFTRYHVESSYLKHSYVFVGSRFVSLQSNQAPRIGTRYPIAKLVEIITPILVRMWNSDNHFQKL